MSLRSVVVRIRQHDWFAVGIEVSILVAGVFMGLQVSNWNEDRKDTARGFEYLQRMQDELRGDVRSLDDISGFWAQVRANGEIALAYAEDGTLEQGSAWRTLLGYYHASQVWPYRKPDTTFQEIRASGELLLIRDAALRARVAVHYGNGAGSQVVEVLGLIPSYRERVRGLTPWRIQQYIWSTCYRTADSKQVLLDCDAPVSEPEALAVLQVYRQSTALTADLRFWMVNVNNGLVLMKDIRKEAEALADAVGGALAGQPRAQPPD